MLIPMPHMPSTGSVVNGVSSVTLAAMPDHAGAMISITPADASSGDAGHQVNLTAGAENTITLTVTAEDGSTKDYTIKVFRERSLVSDNATLGSLTVTDASSGAAQTLDPAFSPSKDGLQSQNSEQRRCRLPS